MENEMKKTLKKLQLNKETIRLMELELVGAADCDYCVSRAFSNCTFCNTRTKWQGDCTQI